MTNWLITHVLHWWERLARRDDRQLSEDWRASWAQHEKELVWREQEYAGDDRR